MGEREAWSQHRIDAIAAVLGGRVAGQLSPDAIRKLARELNGIHERRHFADGLRRWSMGLLPSDAIGITGERELKADCALIAEMLPPAALSEDQEGEDNG